MIDTNEYVSVFKALADETRIKIIELLSCGEMCACDILEYFQITQPTLSYHLKILTDCGLVMSRKEGTWMRYRNNDEMINNMKEFWSKLTSGDETCICKTIKEAGRCD